MPAWSTLLGMIATTSHLLASLQGAVKTDPLDEARVAFKARQFVTAKYATLRVIKTLEKEDAVGKADAHTLLAEILYESNEPSKDVLRNGHIALTAARTSLHERLIGQACLILGRTYLQREKNPKRAEAYLIEAATCLEFADPKGSAQASWNLFDVHRPQGDTVAALADLDRSLRLYQVAKVDDVVEIKRARVATLLALGRLDEAVVAQKGVTPVPPDLLARLEADVDQKVGSKNVQTASKAIESMLAVDRSPARLFWASNQLQSLGLEQQSIDRRLEWLRSTDDLAIVDRELAALRTRLNALSPASTASTTQDKPVWKFSEVLDLFKRFEYQSRADRARLVGLDSSWTALPDDWIELEFRVAMSTADRPRQTAAFRAMALSNDLKDAAFKTLESWPPESMRSSAHGLCDQIGMFARAVALTSEGKPPSAVEDGPWFTDPIHGALLAKMVRDAVTAVKNFDRGQLDLLWLAATMGDESSIDGVIDVLDVLQPSFPVSLRALASLRRRLPDDFDEEKVDKVNQALVSQFDFQTASLVQGASLSEAIILFEELATVKRTRDRAWEYTFTLLQAYVRLIAGDFDGTRELLKQMGQISAGFTESDLETYNRETIENSQHALEAEILLGSGDIVGAREQFLGLRIKGDFRSSGLARVYYAMGLDRIAGGFAESAIDLSDGLDMQDAQCISILCAIDARAGDSDRSIARLRSNLTRQPDGILQELAHASLKNQLAQFLYSKGAAEEADKLSRDAAAEAERVRGAGLPSVVGASQLGPKGLGDMRVVSTSPPPTAKPAGSIRTMKNYALVVGTDEYRNYGRLSNAVRDAISVGEVLARDYGFDVTPLKNPTEAEFKATLDKLRRMPYGPNDQLLVYISGHGARNPISGGLLIFSDTAKDVTEPSGSNGYAMSMLENGLASFGLEENGCKHILVMIDTCFSGDFVKWFAQNRQEQAMKGEPKLDPAALLDRLRYRTRLVITSGEAREEVSDGKPGENSPFAERILQKLRQPGEMGIVSYYTLCDATTWLGTKRLASRFADDTVGSDFFFIRKDALARVK